LIDAARELNNIGKLIIPIIDDAHLIPIHALRKLRLLLEDFPENHNLILFGQSSFNATLQLRINEDIRSRVTYSATLPACRTRESASSSTANSTEPDSPTPP